MSGNIKTWKILAALLVVLNLALLFTIWFRPGGDKDLVYYRPGEGGPKDALTELLKLDVKQQAAYEQLKKAHRDSINVLMKESHEMRNRFFDQLKTDSVDYGKVATYATAISAYGEDIEMLTFEHFRKVREICTTEQKKVFDEVINDAMHKMARGPKGKNSPHENHP